MVVRLRVNGFLEFELSQFDLIGAALGFRNSKMVSKPIQEWQIVSPVTQSHSLNGTLKGHMVNDMNLFLHEA